MMMNLVYVYTIEPVRISWGGYIVVSTNFLEGLGNRGRLASKVLDFPRVFIIHTES